jgi:hypothetical protein
MVGAILRAGGREERGHVPTYVRLIALALLTIVGCGKGAGNRGAIDGQVTLDGKPILKGSIRFVPTAGTKGTVAGGPIENGRYRLSVAGGPAVGSNHVEIHAARKTGRLVPKAMAPAGQMEEEQGEAVAPQFNSATTLTVEVKPGDNTADFAVGSK